MSLVVLPIDGVLSDGPVLMRSECSSVGRALYDLVATAGVRPVLLASEPNEDLVRTWLLRESIGRFSGLACYPKHTSLSYPMWRLQKMRDMHAAGHHIGFYIDSDAEVVAEAVRMGVNGLLVAPSSKVPGESQQDYRPWYDLVQAVEEQAVLRGKDAVEEGAA